MRPHQALFVFLCMCFSVTCLAGAMVRGEVTEINLGVAGDYVRIKLSGDYQDPSGCAPTGGFGGKDFYVAELKTQNHNRFLSLIIAANMKNKQIGMFIDGCTDKEYWGERRPRPIDIYIN